uniref:Uncharacterized protein n=1 Tax=Eptatretus burgeri TaxID=7764 RepID=A0A8C4Q386_EPTBU
MNKQMNEMKTKMETNTNEMKVNAQGMKEEMKELRGEMQQIGRSLQAGMKATTVEIKMAMPRVGANELGGSATVVRPAVEAGKEKIIRGTCLARSVTVTEREKLIGVTETCTREIRDEVKGIGRERKEQLRRKARMRYAEIIKEQGVKQREGRERLKEKARLTYVKIRERRQKEAETKRHEETIETNKCTETREIEGELDGVRDAHTRTELVEDDEGELAERVGTRCEQLDSLLQERGEGVCPLEANHDQVGSVVLCEFEGRSAANRCTPRLGV